MEASVSCSSIGDRQGEPGAGAVVTPLAAARGGRRRGYYLLFLPFLMAGLPKAAVVTHERVWAASFIQGVCGVTSDDIFYINLPLYHSAGFLIGMSGAIERGADAAAPLRFGINTPSRLTWAWCRFQE